MPEQPSHAYWRSRSGVYYENQQREHRASGNSSYEQQERWLVAFLTNLARTRGRPIRLLDFGCGFGRIARLLHAVPEVRYHGFDFSATMVEPLRDEDLAGLRPFDQHVRVGPNVAEVFDNGRFDVILTVSVLIHNPPDVVADVLGTLLAMVDADGALVLIENKLVRESAHENDWHGGCWVHAYLDHVPEHVNVHVSRGIVDTHDIYELRTSTKSASRTLSISEGDGAARILTRDEFRLMGADSPSGASERHVETERIALAGRAHDLEEELGGARNALEAAERALEQTAAVYARFVGSPTRTIAAPTTAPVVAGSADRMGARCHALAARLESLAHAFEEVTARANALEERLALRGSVEACIRAMPAPEPTPSQRMRRHRDEAPGTPSYVLDDERDRMVANEDARFRHVCHAFHTNWLGIRAAAGSLPGHKLALAANRSLSTRDVERLLVDLEARQIRVLVVHGWSWPMHALVRSLRAASSVEIFLVWHGTTTQWAVRDERELALGALAAARDGLVHGFSAIRRGLEPFSGPRTFAPQLLNAPPCVRTAIPRGARRIAGALAFAPSWNDLRKNLATNLLAAQAVPRIARTYYTARDLELPSWIAPRIERTAFRDQTKLLEFMSTVDVVLNATTIDCHPMVDLEALSVGTPAVRGRLFLDALEDHPYARATVVENVLSASDIAQVTTRVLSIPERELEDMMLDYKARLLELSVNRYAEFLRI